MFLLPTSIIINFDPQDNPFRSRESENLDFELQSFSNKTRGLDRTGAMGAWHPQNFEVLYLAPVKF